MADKKRPKGKFDKKPRPPKPRPPLDIIRIEDDRGGVKYCWKPVLFEGGAYAKDDGPKARGADDESEALAFVGGGGAMPKQVDPDSLSYSIYNAQIQANNGIWWLAKLLSTKAAVGGYPPFTEGWRFSLQTVTSALAASTSLQLIGASYDSTQTPLGTYWFPPEPGWVNNEFTMPSSTTYLPATHTANQPVLFEAPFQTNYKMRLGFNLAINAQGKLTGTLTWFHNKPNFVGYLVRVGVAYSFTRLAANPSWSGQWYEDFYQSPP